AARRQGSGDCLHARAGSTAADRARAVHERPRSELVGGRPRRTRRRAAMITVRLPLLLRPDPVRDTLTFDQPLASIAELVDALETRLPGLRAQLEDSVFNFAINDELILQHAAARPLADGDTVEIIPTISGGAR